MKTYINFFPLGHIANQSRESEKPNQTEEFHHPKNFESPSGMNELETAYIVTKIL